MAGNGTGTRGSVGRVEPGAHRRAPAALAVEGVLRSPGQPLEHSVRREMEPRLGHDLSHVRVHADGRAAEATQALGARAFAVGADVVFAAGRYQPASRDGWRLIAHELAHSLQQRHLAATPAAARALWPTTRRGDPAERAADQAAEQVASERGRPVLAAAPPAIALQPEPESKPEESAAEPSKEPPGGKDKPAKLPVIVSIEVDLASESVVFRTADGELYEGSVSTDLEPGTYELHPEPGVQKWGIKGSKPGLRFWVSLDDADPWTSFAYSDQLPLTVGAGGISEDDAFDTLDSLVQQQIANVVEGIGRITPGSRTMDALLNYHKKALPQLRRMAQLAKGFVTAGRASKTASERSANFYKAGAHYQAALITAGLLQVEANMVLLCEYADDAGVPFGVVKQNLEAFDDGLMPLAQAALTFDPVEMSAALKDAAPKLETTTKFISESIPKIGENAALSRKVILGLDILMLAFSVYSVAKAPVVGGGPPSPPTFGRVFSGGTAAMAGVSAIDLKNAIEAIRKLIAMGALQPGVIAGLGTIGVSSGSAIPDLGKPQAMQMAKPRVVPPRSALAPGKSELAEYDMDTYGTFKNRPGDKLAGHEMLQNAWLRANGKITGRGVGRASTDNPAVALGKDMHDAVSAEQRKLGLFNEKTLKGMTVEANIEANALAMRNAGVPEGIIQALRKEALRHATSLAQ